MQRRDFLRLTSGTAIAAACVVSRFPASYAEGKNAGSIRNGQDLDHLHYLTEWYAAMDSSSGRAVQLFRGNISYLMANNAIWGGEGLQRRSYGGPHQVKNSFVEGWNSNSQYMRWNISAQATENFRIHALMGQCEGATVRVEVGDRVLDRKLTSNILDKVNLGEIEIPKGDSTLTISVPSGEFEMTLFSLELYPVAASRAIRKRIASSRSEARWMAHTPMGMMYQWGQWGGNAQGQGSPWPACYAEFDYPSFAQRLKNEGADFLVWSLTYSEYYIAAPIRAVDEILPGRTSKVDYLDRLLTECRKRGIRVIFYYHAGHDPNPNPDWWNAFWTAPLEGNGVYARKQAPMARFLKIFAEIGHRYGEKLDGWMLDDGGIYYPAPFDLLSGALRAGNSNRIISFNSAYLFHFAPRMTDFEDYYFGETPKGKSLIDWPTNAEGVYTDGPFVGEHGFANFQTESGNWGYFNDASAARIGMKPDHSLDTTMSADRFDAIAVHSRGTHVMAAYNFRMYEDGAQSQTSLQRFKTAASLAHES